MRRLIKAASSSATLSGSLLTLKPSLKAILEIGMSSCDAPLSVSFRFIAARERRWIFSCDERTNRREQELSEAAAVKITPALLVLDHHRHRYKTGESELLYPSVLRLQRRHFRRVQIAFRIDGQVVQRTELSRS